MKRQIKINDTLDERLSSAKDDVKQELINYIESNDLTIGDDVPSLNDLDFSGAIFEIADGAVPIYSSEIRDLWYLYSDRFASALDDAGIGTGPEEEDRQKSAIYCYMQQEIAEWYSEESEEIFNQHAALDESDVHDHVSALIGKHGDTTSFPTLEQVKAFYEASGYPRPDMTKESYAFKHSAIYWETSYTAIMDDIDTTKAKEEAE